MKSILGAVTLTISLVPLALAGGGSNYTIFGIGDLRTPMGTRSAGMGYTGIALPSTSSINTVAPATWANFRDTRIEAGFLYEGFNSSDGSRSLYLANTSFNGALIGIPISTVHGVVFVGGVTPYSDVDYNVFETGSQQGIDYTLNHVGSGGLGRALAGLSYAPAPVLSFGASFDYLFGAFEGSRTLTPTSISYVGGKTRDKFDAHGFTATIGGLLSSLGGVHPSLEPVSVGFSLTSRTSLGTEGQFVYEFLSETDSSGITNSTLTLPFAYRVGLGYRAGERLLLAADYHAHLWEHAMLTGSDPPEIRNSYRFGIGAERQAVRDPGASWPDKLVYRLGFSYNATYYRINGQPINEWTVTGGFGIPLSGENRLHLALEYGQRGTLSYQLLKENIIRLHLSVTMSEEWFVGLDEE